MRRYSVMYFISQSFKGLWRNGVMTLASITVLMSCLVVMGSFALLVANLNENLDSLGDMNEIVVFIDPEVSDERVDEIKAEIDSMDNVKSTELITQEQALEQEKEKYESEYPDFFKDISSDIYPASIVITYRNNAKVPTLKYDLENNFVTEEGKQEVYKVNCRSDVAETIETMKNGIIWIFVWFLAVLFVVSLFVIINTIKLAVFGRRQEISVMRYVGATNWFIMTPFVLEGIFIGLISSGIAFGIEVYIYKFIQGMVQSDYSMFSIIPFGELQNWLLLVFVGIGVLTGVIGSSISLRKNLRA